LRGIVTSFVRVNNILKNRSLPTQGDTSLFNEYEKALYQKYSEIEPSFSNSLREENYSDGLSLLSQFTPLINTFFEKVLIIAEDTKIRQNRLYLLSLVLNLYKKIADFSILNIE
jgi:glycyl-tRNA synthetase beta chain